MSSCVHFSVVEAARAKFPLQVSPVFRHWPRSYHRFAYASARAAECASAQDKFQEFYRFVYSKQDSLGIIAFHDIGVRIGVRDIAAYDACTAISGKVQAVEDDIAAARAIKGRGTPTIIINGVEPARLPTLETLEDMVKGDASQFGKSRRQVP